MARQARSQCKSLGWVVYAETFLAVAAFSCCAMLCIDGAFEDGDLVVSKPLAPAFPSAVVAKLDTSSSLDTSWHDEELPVPAGAGLAREDVLREEPGREKPRCESKMPAFTTTFVIAFMAGGFMNVERVQGLPIP
jgi:hypothetical protein